MKTLDQQPRHIDLHYYSESPITITSLIIESDESINYSFSNNQVFAAIESPVYNSASSYSFLPKDIALMSELQQDSGEENHVVWNLKNPVTANTFRIVLKFGDNFSQLTFKAIGKDSNGNALLFK